LASLADLKQENDWVRTKLLEWIKDLVKKYHIDGIRIDTVP
jgi:glycosidase